MKDSAGLEYKFHADNHNDLVWLYYQFKTQKGMYKEVTLHECTGLVLKPRLRVSVELVGERIKEEIVYDSPLAEHIHCDKFIDT